MVSARASLRRCREDAGRHVRHHEPRIFLLAHCRQFPDERHGGPELRVAVIAPGRHPGHLDAVLDDPEKLGGAVKRRGFGKVRRRWVKTSGDIAARHPGRAVTDGAVRCEMFDRHRDVRRVVEARRDLDSGRVGLDRADAGGFYHPAGDWPMQRGCRHVVNAGSDHGEAAQQRKNSGDEDGGDEAPHARLPQNQVRMPKTKRTSPALSPARRAKLAVWPNFPS